METTATAGRTRRIRFGLPILTPGKLKLFLKLAAGVEVPDHRVCPHHATPWEAFCDAYFAKSPASVWKASRGFGGKSFLLALLAWCEAITLRADVNVLAGSGQQSKRVLAAMAKFWSHPYAPQSILSSEPAQETVRFKGGQSIQALLASSASVRGPHPQRLRLDEVDEMDLDILDAALGQPMASDRVPAQVVMSSTHHYTNGCMTETLNRASARGWPVFEWCYKETLEPHGWNPQAEVDRQKALMSDFAWMNEVELQDPIDRGNLVFPAFDRDIHVKPTAYDPTMPLYMGADMGRGTYAVGFHQVTPDNGLRTIAEATYHDRDTEDVCRDLWANHADLCDRVEVIAPDRSGAGHTSTSRGNETDHAIFRRYFKDAIIRVSNRPQHRNPEWGCARMRDLLRSADGQVRYQVDPSCGETIRSWTQSVYPEVKPGKAEKDDPTKDGITDHHRDQTRYTVIAAFHIGRAVISSRKLV